MEQVVEVATLMPVDRLVENTVQVLTDGTAVAMVLQLVLKYVLVSVQDSVFKTGATVSMTLVTQIWTG